VSAQLEVISRTASPRAPGDEHRPRMGFIGLGWIGRKRLDALDPASIEVAALAESDASRLHAAAAAHPDAIAAQTVEALLDAELDGVVIATPNGLHAQQAIACLERGIPVFCQKPLATNLRDVERVVAAARAADRLLGIDFCYRHVSGMHELRRRVQAGEIGDVIAVDLTFHNAYGPDKSWCQDRRLAGGGCLMDLGVHLLDLCLWLQGMPPTERVRSRLFAQGVPVQGCDAVEDLAFAEFIQANGAIVRLACSWHAHIGQGAIIQIAIAGTRGGAHWTNIDGSFYDFQLDLIHGTNRERLSGRGGGGDWGPRALQAWIEQLRISNRFDPEADEIIRSAALIEEVYRA
jgi:predicted dehydrogenase